VTLTFNGVNTCENSVPNPFTDYRLNVTFTNGSSTYSVPGFYAADGDAANTGAGCGNKWRVHFTPDATGIWNYTVSFRTGTNVAINSSASAGTPVVMLDGTSGSFSILPTDKTGKDFRAKGMLRYAGLHHFQFAETGDYYLKGGADSPENFLAYHEFDQTNDLGGGNDQTLVNGLHQYAPHVQDWNPSDPTWQSGKGKGIIGALNYLASQNANSVYFLTYNINGGDGLDTWMWTSYTERHRFDCSKLDQWEIVFSHMDLLGIQMHVVTQEQENDQSLGDSLRQLNDVRMLYYRELVARFSHHLAVQWNLGEENTNTNAERASFAQYIREMDAYDHPITVHMPNGVANTFYDTIFTTPSYLQYFEAASIQGTAGNYNSWAGNLRNESAAVGKKWAVYGDEQIPSVTSDGSNFDELRRDALWGNLMGGGAGVEWYFGYQGAFGDIQSEDFRAIEPLWQHTRYALEFFQNHLPFHLMAPGNNLLSNEGDNDLCLAKAGQVYAIYLESAGGNNTVLNISLPGSYDVKWYNPRAGGSLQNGSITTLNVTSPGNFLLGQPPVSGSGDWVVLITGNYTAMSISVSNNNVQCFGNNSGGATAIVANGAPPYSYQWSNGQSTSAASNLAAGLYKVTVTDAFAYSITDSVLITQPAALEIAGSVTVSGGYGQIFLNVSGGTSPYSYSWSSGDTTAGIDSLSSGIYCATVTDANGCTLSECDTIEIAPCEQPRFVCNDNNPCTIDSCISGQCVSTPVNCDDGDFCTNDICDEAGQCVHSTVTCDDSNACTLDSCDDGQCAHHPVACNDNNSCTTDSCVNGGCIFLAVNCNDQNLCTNDICDSLEQCVYTPINCADNNACTIDNCIPASGCNYSQVICPDDGSLCTTESCSVGQCISTPIVCNDNISCTTDACNNGQCAYTLINCNDSNPCTTDGCNNGQCVFTAIICNDNIACTADACNNGSCAYTPVECNDNNLCTTDACSSGQCIYTPVSLAVSSLTLINSVSDADVRILKNSDTINLAVTPSVNIRANVCQPLGSVKFVLNGSTYKTESSAPYALAGDASGNYNKWSVSTGLYTLTATPYSGTGASGAAGTGKTISLRVINQQAPACTTNSNCNDNNACTNDVCQTGQCVNSAINCSDNNLCTNDICSNGACTNPAIVCNDNNACTTDECVTATGCTYSTIANCCNSNADCNDNNPCTVDACSNGNCTYTQGGSEPSYLRIINPVKSYKKLKLGYSSTSLYNPKQNVTASGNNTLCITLRAVGTPEWSKIQVRPQGSGSAAVALGNYLSGAVPNWTTGCIPFSAFASVNFTQLSFIEMPFSNNANAFEIHIQRIRFTGGTTPFLWFGDTHTDNYHDGQSGSSSALIATLIAGSPCGGSSKMDASDSGTVESFLPEIRELKVYPVPFEKNLKIEFVSERKGTGMVKIISVTGQIIQSETMELETGGNQKIFYMPEELAAGIYFLEFRTENYRKFVKICKSQ